MTVDTPRRACDMRWIAMVACVYAAMATGTSYVFGVYSGSLHNIYNFTIGELDTITMVGGFSGVLTFVGGVITDRCGPSIAVLLGGIIMVASFTLFYLVGVGTIDATPLFPDDPGRGPLVIFSTLMFLIYFSSGSITAGVFAAVVRNFPGQKGSAVGFVKGFVGICGGLYTQTYVASFGVPDNSPSTLRFLLLIAGFVFVFAVLLSPLVRVSKNEPKMGARAVRDRKCMFRFLFGGLFVFIATVTTAGILENALQDSSNFTIVMQCMLGLIVLELLFPVVGVVALFLRSSTGNDNDNVLEEHDTNREVPLLQEVVGEENTNARNDKGNESKEITAVFGETSLLKVLCSFDAYLLLFVTIALGGAGFMFTTNVNELCASEEMSAAAPSIGVTLFSTFQALGRVLFGVWPDIALARQSAADARCQSTGAEHGDHSDPKARKCNSRFRISRVSFFSLVLLLTIVGNAMQLVQGETVLYISTAINGLAFGGLWPLLVVSSADLWGKQNVGANYMFFDGFTNMLGGTLFGKFLPQAFFDRFSTDGGGTCVGSDCFFYSHLVVVGTSLLAFVASLVLGYRINRKIAQSSVGRSPQVH